MLLLSLGAIVLLLLLAGFFSGSETALTAVSRGRMHQLEQDGSRAARDVNRLMSNRERLIGALLLGNTFVNILASSLATTLLEARLGPRAVAVTTLIMTLVVLLFAEVLPKTLAIVRTDHFALAVAAPVRRVVAVLAPIVAAVQWLVWRLFSLFGLQAKQGEEESADAAHEEIRGAVALHHQEGSVEREHRNMIGGILDLRELKVADVALHRTNMVSVDADLPPADILAAIIDARHTRVPLWRGEPENIVGVLHITHLAHALLENKGNIAGIDIMALATPPWFVPDTTTLEEQLQAFRERRNHFALVVDEYGVLMGLVTLEDILTEIIGELPDENQARPDVRKQSDGSYLVGGTVPLRDLNREFDWHLPDEEATTIAGLVIQESGTIPEPGQRFAFFGFKFEVLRRQRNQITALRIIPPGEPPARVARGHVQ